MLHINSPPPANSPPPFFLLDHDASYAFTCHCHFCQLTNGPIYFCKMPAHVSSMYPPCMSISQSVCLSAILYSCLHICFPPHILFSISPCCLSAMCLSPLILTLLFSLSLYILLLIRMFLSFSLYLYIWPV